MKMDRILYGDNQFFAVNHISDEKSRAQSIKFKEDKTILDTIDIARGEGVESFMCTTHDRIINICDMIRKDPEKYKNFSIYPCMPYAHKYANAVTELGIMGTIKQYVPGNFFGSLFKGGMAFVSKDYISIMELMIDAEMKMFQRIEYACYLSTECYYRSFAWPWDERYVESISRLCKKEIQCRAWIYHDEHADVIRCIGKCRY